MTCPERRGKEAIGVEVGAESVFQRTQYGGINVDEAKRTRVEEL